MKAVLLLLSIFVAAFSGAAAIGPIGGGGGGGGSDPTSVTVYASDLVTFTGYTVNGADQVTIKITTPSGEAVTSLSSTPDPFGNISANWFPPVDATFNVIATTYLGGVELSTETVAIVSVVRPDASGHITGGGWYWNNPGKDTMGYVAQVLGNGNVRGNFEFQDHGNLYKFKSTSVDWVYAPNCTEGFFSGFTKMNGSGSYRFFVHVFDNGEPGSGDSVDFEVYNPTSGALIYSYGHQLTHGNVQIHCN